MSMTLQRYRLDLEPGHDYMLLIRIENIGSKILPIRLSKPGAFLADALAEQMVQGMLTGLSLCLLLYSLAQWINLREPLFGHWPRAEMDLETEVACDAARRVMSPVFSRSPSLPNAPR